MSRTHSQLDSNSCIVVESCCRDPLVFTPPPPLFWEYRSKNRMTTLRTGLSVIILLGIRPFLWVVRRFVCVHRPSPQRQFFDTQSNSQH